MRAVCSDLVHACEPSTVVHVRDVCAGGTVYQCLPPSQFAVQRRQFRDAHLEHVLVSNAQSQQQQQQQQRANAPATRSGLASVSSSVSASAAQSPRVSRPTSVNVAVAVAAAVAAASSALSSLDAPSHAGGAASGQASRSHATLASRLERLDLGGGERRIRLHRLPEELARAWDIHEMLVKPATQAATFIASLVTQVYRLPLALREVHVLTSMRLFTRKAAMLAAFIDSRMYGCVSWLRFAFRLFFGLQLC